MEALSSLAPLALDRGIDLGFDREETGEPGPLTVHLSPTLVREMIANLVDNALRYTPPGGSVAVRLSRSAASDGPAAGEILIRIVDTGPGIPAAERERVFERFYRVPGTGTEGHGLGLAIVREIAEGAGGGVRLDDGPDGRGLAVTVRLPEEAGPAADQ